MIRNAAVARYKALRPTLVELLVALDQQLNRLRVVEPAAADQEQYDTLQRWTQEQRVAAAGDLAIVDAQLAALRGRIGNLKPSSNPEVESATILDEWRRAEGRPMARARTVIAVLALDIGPDALLKKIRRWES